MGHVVFWEHQSKPYSEVSDALLVCVNKLGTGPEWCLLIIFVEKVSKRLMSDVLWLLDRLNDRAAGFLRVDLLLCFFCFKHYPIICWCLWDVFCGVVALWHHRRPLPWRTIAFCVLCSLHRPRCSARNSNAAPRPRSGSEFEENKRLWR